MKTIHTNQEVNIESVHFMLHLCDSAIADMQHSINLCIENNDQEEADFISMQLELIEPWFWHFYEILEEYKKRENDKCH